ncbi:Elongator subunit elp4 [Rhizophlyctis rosea]|nr:Elongator subunit elp4 [Rhizophlyctis rosea]
MSSFKRRTPTATSNPPPATRISAHNGQTLVSTGVPSLDEVLGGGLPQGSLLLLKEDRFTGYAHLLFKYFIAQGIASGHAVCVASADENPEDLVRGLMGVVEGAAAETAAEEEGEDGDVVEVGAANVSGRALGALRAGGEDSMKIAWRYQGLPRFASALTTGAAPGIASPRRDTTTPQVPYCNIFDLTKTISPTLLTNAASRLALLDLTTWPSLSQPTDTFYTTLYDQIASLISQGGFSLTSPSPSSSPRPFLIIAIHSIASPFWPSSSNPHAITLFLHRLKLLLRTTSASCILTLPAHLYGDFHALRSVPFIRRIEHTCDAVIEVESFAGSPSPINPLYTSDYSGLFHPRKLPRLATLNHSSRLTDIELKSLGFKVRRKRFSIETFHLPPEGEDTGARSQDGSDKRVLSKGVGDKSRQVGAGVGSKSSGMGCGTGGGGAKNSLDF